MNAALSATTVNTIQGTKPYLLLKDGETKLLSLNELLGFSMPKQDGAEGTEQIDASMASKVITAPSGMRFQDITALVAVDGQLHDVDALVGDDEGDALLKENTSVSGKMKATWSDGGAVVADLSKTLSACGGPYTLKLEIPKAVSANTKYGDPHTNNYGTHSGVAYTFISAEQGVCYLEPGSMRVNTGTEGVDVKYANGYNPAVWEYDTKTYPYHKGFKASSGFPTIGFYGARFYVIGSGNNQRNYRCRVDSGSWVELSGSASQKLGQNCTVTYNTEKKPTTPVTIYLDYKVNGGNDWKEVDSYTISVPKKWVRIAGKEEYNSAYSFTGFYGAAELCGAPKMKGLSEFNINTASSYFFDKTELTNSPKANGGYSIYSDKDGWMQIGEKRIGGAFSRDVDGTLMGEWGALGSYTYNPILSGLVGSRIWTANLANSESVYTIEVTNGWVNLGYPTQAPYLVVCR